MKTVLFIIIVCVFSTVINAQPKLKVRYKKTDSGLGFKILKKGKGKKVEKSERLFIHYSLYYQSDKNDSLKPVVVNGQKDFIVGQEEVLKGWDEGFLLLKEGDSVLFKIPPHLAYGDKKVGKIPSSSTLYLQAKLYKIEEAFFPHLHADTITFPSGLKKILVKSGGGKKTSISDEVRMRFTGYVYSTKGYRQIFESYQKTGQESIFQLGVGRMISGIDEGVSSMYVGEKATFIIPPKLGFGNQQVGKILPNTTLYFDIELIDSEWPFLEPLNTDTIAQDSVKLILSEKNVGPKITCEDVVSFHYKAYHKNEEGKFVIHDNSFERNQPLTQRPAMGMGFPGVEEILQYLKKGEKATIIVPYNISNSRKKNPSISKGSLIYYDIYILDVFKYPFLNIASKDTITLPSGLKYLYDDIGSGLEITKGSKINVAYTVYYLDENGFRHLLDGTRDSGKKLEVTVGNGKNIIGFEEGLLGMKPGSVKRLIIPPKLGYGENGLPNKGIPAKTNLIFDIEFLELIH